MLNFICYIGNFFTELQILFTFSNNIYKYKKTVQKQPFSNYLSTCFAEIIHSNIIGIIIALAINSNTAVLESNNLKNG